MNPGTKPCTFHRNGIFKILLWFILEIFIFFIFLITDYFQIVLSLGVSDRTMQKPNSTFHMTCQWIFMKFGMHANIVIL
jgi:hypothetical protein